MEVRCYRRDMPRIALILSCVIHGSVLAVVGWSSLVVAPRPDHSGTKMSASLLPGENALVSGGHSGPRRCCCTDRDQLRSASAGSSSGINTTVDSIHLVHGRNVVLRPAEKKRLTEPAEF